MKIRIKNQKGFAVVEGVIILAIVGTIGGVGWYVYQRSDSKKSASSTTSIKKAVPAKTIDKTGAFKLKSASAGSCTALLPVGWSSPTTNDTSSTFDAFSPNKTMYAGYGHQAINTQLASFASAYTEPLNDPNLYSNDTADVALAYTKIIVGNLEGDAAVGYTSETNETVGDYQLRSVTSSTHQGVVFFRTTGFPGDGTNYSYSLPMYFSLASKSTWQSAGFSLARVTASISCNTQLVARSSGPDIGGEASAEDQKDKNGEDEGYNPQLGTEYVHDPNTGENYVVDPSRDWSNSGPNGAGYYTPKGTNDYTQLEPGRVD